jgi:cytochrome c oxidase subunit II
MKKIISIFLLLLLSSNAFAELPNNWQLGLSKSVTSIMDDIRVLHDYILLPIITVICVFVLFLILYAVYKFRESKNSNPSTT